MRSKMSTTIRIVESISHLLCYSRRVNCGAGAGAGAKFHARETVSRTNAIMVSGVHDEARRLRVAAAFLAAAERSAAGRLADAWPPSRPPFCDEAWDSG